MNTGNDVIEGFYFVGDGLLQLFRQDATQCYYYTFSVHMLPLCSRSYIAFSFSAALSQVYSALTRSWPATPYCSAAFSSCSRADIFFVRSLTSPGTANRPCSPFLKTLLTPGR